MKAEGFYRAAAEARFQHHQQLLWKNLTQEVGQARGRWRRRSFFFSSFNRFFVVLVVRIYVYSKLISLVVSNKI